MPVKNGRLRKADWSQSVFEFLHGYAYVCSIMQEYVLILINQWESSVLEQADQSESWDKLSVVTPDDIFKVINDDPEVR